MSGTGPEKAGHVPDIVLPCPEYGQLFLTMFRTSMCDVRNMTRIFGHILYITGPVTDIPGNIPDITGPIPDITGHIPDITGPIPDINFIPKSMSGIRPG